jgi:hypothetical protein
MRLISWIHPRGSETIVFTLLITEIFSKEKEINHYQNQISSPKFFI